jgi:hypothetical protein
MSLEYEPASQPLCGYVRGFSYQRLSYVFPVVEPEWNSGLPSDKGTTENVFSTLTLELTGPGPDSGLGLAIS